MRPVILAIESSCDETAAAVIDGGRVCSNIISSQPIHEAYGGVVPELASRAHQRNIAYVVDRALSAAGTARADLQAIAFTQGPGLLGALLVGVSFAKAMALALRIPLLAVHHMHAHVMANFIDAPKPSFPFLCLTVSGGHTQIVLAHDHLDMNVIGETRDDAVGEAFDKAARILGLPYPGGPSIDRLARHGDADAFSFPHTEMPLLDFSFSGIKTAFLYFVRDQHYRDPSFLEKRKNDLCASLQKHLVAMLLDRLAEASAQTGIKQIAIAGGVSANSALRKALNAKAAKLGWKAFVPAMPYCTDNAAMIATAAHYQFLRGDFVGLEDAPRPRFPLDEYMRRTRPSKTP